MGEMNRHQPHDPAQLRISDADRHRVAELLRTAAGEGRLDLEELDERLEQTFAAKTYADLVPITVDLQPATTTSATPAPRPAAHLEGMPGHATSIAIMGERKRRGAWHVPESHTAFALMGAVLIDLREATLSSRDTTINASAIMGEVKIYVPAHVNVIVEGVPIMADYGQSKDKIPAEIGPDSPIVRVKGIALMGSVEVSRLPPPGTPRKFLGTY